VREWSAEFSLIRSWRDDRSPASFPNLSSMRCARWPRVGITLSGLSTSAGSSASPEGQSLSGGLRQPDSRSRRRMLFRRQMSSPFAHGDLHFRHWVEERFLRRMGRERQSSPAVDRAFGAALMDADRRQDVGRSAYSLVRVSPPGSARVDNHPRRVTLSFAQVSKTSDAQQPTVGEVCGHAVCRLSRCCPVSLPRQDEDAEASTASLDEQCVGTSAHGDRSAIPDDWQADVSGVPRRRS